MKNDPIVEEMRAYGKEFAEQNGNDINRICIALREKEKFQKRKVVHREPRRIKNEIAS